MSWSPDPFTLPEGKAVVVLPFVIVEMYKEGVNPPREGFARMPNDKKDHRTLSIYDYASKVASLRLLEILDQERVSGTIEMQDRAIKEYPNVISEYHKHGHEVMAHSYSQDTGLNTFETPEEERAQLRRSIDAISKVIGERPMGWSSPHLASADDSLELIAEEGFKWCHDFSNDEAPYVVEVGGKPLVILPHHNAAEVNDVGEPKLTPTMYIQEFKNMLDSLREDFYLTGRAALIDLSVHAHLFGHSRSRYAFRESIRYAKGFPDVIFMKKTELADWVLSQYKQAKK